MIVSTAIVVITIYENDLPLERRQPEHGQTIANYKSPRTTKGDRTREEPSFEKVERITI